VKKLVFEGFFKDMKNNMAVFTVLTAIILTSICPSIWAIDPRIIDPIRKKGVLSSSDFEVIEQFWSDLTTELLNTHDFTGIARTRAIAVTRQSDQAQYNEQYIKFAREYLGHALQKSKSINDKAMRHKVRMNLAILIAEFKNTRLIDLAISLLTDEDKAVQYWAMRSLTSPEIIQQVIKSESMMNRIVSAMEKNLSGAEPKTLNLLVDFSAQADSAKAKALLFKITDLRLVSYEDGSVGNFLIDAKILKSLCDKLIANRDKATEIGPKFGQMFSYSFQKYIQMLEQKGTQNKTAKQQLASVLIETEDKCIEQLTGLSQTVIRRSIEASDARVLLIEHDRLLGSGTKKGEIPQKFAFDYGQADDGSRMTKPKLLQ